MNYEDQMIPMRGGKKYLPVAPRVKMFRDEHPGGRIDATIVELDRERKFCLCEASIYLSDGQLLAKAHGSEDAADFADYIEKAETKAIGRALSLAGYGTLSAADIEEGAVVDTPQEQARPAPIRQDPPRQQQDAAPGDPPITACTNCAVLCAPPVVKFSVSKYGKVLCRNCQSSAAR